MQHVTISRIENHYVKIRFSPHDPDGPPLDAATLHILLTRAVTEMYGKVGAGAISGLGNGVEVVEIIPSNDNSDANTHSRDVLLKVASR